MCNINDLVLIPFLNVSTQINFRSTPENRVHLISIIVYIVIAEMRLELKQVAVMFF